MATCASPRSNGWAAPKTCAPCPSWSFVSTIGFQRSGEAPSAELVRLLERALSDPDTSIRQWAAQAVSSRPTDRSLLGAIQLMEHDHLMPVRREALRWHLRQSGDAREAALEAALLDPHP